MKSRKWLKRIFIFLLLLVIIYALGPTPDTPEYTTTLPQVPASPDQLNNFIALQEAQHTLKEDNEAKIIWANDSMPAKTKYALVYLHGFSASPQEGHPLHQNIAKKFGYNLYLPRLAKHGIDTIEPLMNLTPEKYWNSAKMALAVGKKLGEKVILIGTSTGGSLALQLAATYPEIEGVILLSPNIAINNDKAWLLNNPWGLQIARLVTGGDYLISDDQRPEYQKYWYAKYRLEVTPQLQELLETTMTEENFQKVKQPVLLLYYYKDEENQDKVVKVDAMLNMFEQLGTPENLKKKKAIPNAGNHVLASPIKSNAVEEVEKEVEDFIRSNFH